MKLELIKKIEPENVDYILTATSLNEGTCIFLFQNKEDIYQLLKVTTEELETIDLGYTEKNYKVKTKPVLFSMGNHFGVLKSAEELLLYSNEDKTPEIIKVQNPEILPQNFRLSYRNPVTDSNILPVCFDNGHDVYEPRYIAFLRLDIEDKKARWESCASLKTSSFPHHRNEDDYPPKLDNLMIKNEDLYAFTSGGKITSVSKWGMDYYALVKGNINGTVAETLIDSGNLDHIDQKKRGVNGLFSSSQKYVMLTPMFQSDEWKGKQRIYSFASNEISEIVFPRGFGKYPQVVQHYGDHFWVFLRDTRDIAICKEK